MENNNYTEGYTMSIEIVDEKERKELLRIMKDLTYGQLDDLIQSIEDIYRKTDHFGLLGFELHDISTIACYLKEIYPNDP